MEKRAMKRVLIVLFAVVAMMGCSQAETGKSKEGKVETKRPRVIMETDMGKIVLELFPDVAPNHVKNFLDLANKGFYDGLTFHRVIKGFVIQGGDPKGDGTGDSGTNVKAEFSNLKHVPGTLSMARAQDPNSASCQFYICLGQLPSLDGKYTIFGQTVEGMDVVNKIGDVKTGPGDKPVTPVRMIRVYEEGKERPAKTGAGE
jgi:peptidyl-prolyl cis-trans isomerase B (cyclophilin B)